APVDVRAWLYATDSSALVLVATVLVGLAVFTRLSSGARGNAAIDMLLVTSIVSFMTSQKLMIRPYNMSEQLIGLLFVPILIYLYVCFDRNRLITQVPLYVAAGALLALFQYRGTTSMVYQRLVVSIPTALRNVSVMTDRRLA